MSQTPLPMEVVLLIIHHTLEPSDKMSQPSLYHSLSMRRVCKAVNTDVLRYYFDGTMLNGTRSSATLILPCKQCQGAIRPERARSVMHKNIVLRYIFGLVFHKVLPKYDMRLRVQKGLLEAAADLKRDLVSGEMATSPVLQERHAGVEVDLGLGSRTIPANHSGTSLSPRNIAPPNLDMDESPYEARALCSAIITLLGVQNTWAFLGPDHASCCPAPLERVIKNKPPAFWKLITAVHLGNENEKLVRKYLESLHPLVAGTGSFARKVDVYTGGDTCVEKASEQSIWLESLSAALTVGIRGGHRDLIKILLSQDKALSKPVINGAVFFRGLSLIDTALVSTSDPDQNIARVAADVVQRLLPHWEDFQNWSNATHIRAVTEIPAKSGVLAECLETVFPRSSLSCQVKACLHMLSQAALDNDFKKASLVLDYVKNVPAHTEDTTQRHRGRDSMWIENYSWKNEHGVRDSRLLDGYNPVRVATAKSHVHILDMLLETQCWRWFRTHLDTRCGVHKYDKDHTNTVQKYRHRDRYSEDLNPIRIAVNDVFVEPKRLAGWKLRRTPDVKGLKAILHTQESKELCWGGEVIACAGRGSAEIFELLVDMVDVHQDFPHLEAPSEICSGRQVIPIFIQGAYARTIGERALAHAVKNLKVDNAKILIDRGVQLVEDVQGEPFDTDDLTKTKQVMEISALLMNAKGTHNSGELRGLQGADGFGDHSPLVIPRFKARASRSSSYVTASGGQGTSLREHRGLKYKRTGDRTTYERRTGRSDPEWEQCDVKGHPIPSINQ